MQYVPGRSLQARVDEDGPLGTEEILRIGMQAASGLAAAHRQGLVHRDVKPSNILLEDTVERAVLTDFGLARTFDDASLTHTGILAGTPHYMSPEQAMGEPIDPRSRFVQPRRRAVFHGDRPSAVSRRQRDGRAAPHLPRHASARVAAEPRDSRTQLSDVIDRLLEKKPAKRFASADEVQQHLATLLSRCSSTASAGGAFAAGEQQAAAAIRSDGHCFNDFRGRSYDHAEHAKTIRHRRPTRLKRKPSLANRTTRP